MTIEGAAPRFGQTVLIVGAEPVQRLLATRLAESIGMTPVEASSNAQAVEILHTRPDITVVFADADVPGQSRPAELARYVAARWPSIQLVVASGVIPEAYLHLPAGCRFIVKPVYPNNLAAALSAPKALT